MTRSPLRAPPRAPLRAADAPPDPDHDLALRHVLPVVGQHNRRGDALALLGGVALIGVLGLGTFWSMSRARPERAPTPVASTAAPITPPQPAPPVIPPAAITPISNPVPIPAPALDTGRVPVPANTTGNPLASAAVVFSAPPIAEIAAAPADAAAAKAAAPAPGGDDFAARLGATGSAGASAALTFDPHHTVAQGTLIPAVLETAIDSDVPGYTRAIVSADVRAFDGNRVLIPRSSRLVGQYKSGLQAGQRRVYVIWTRLIRPDGVAVALGSPGTDFAGGSGLAGKVDTHFFDRFGSAMLLTVMGGLGSLGNSNTSVVIGGAGQSAAAAAIGQSAQIGPTVRIRPGEPIRVFTARDLDFGQTGTP